MRVMQRVLLAGAALLIGAQAVAANFSTQELSAVRMLQRQALASNEAYALVESLTTDVGPRSAGSAGDAAAVQWAMKRLRDLGFSNVHTQPVTVPNWNRGEAHLTLLGTPSQSLSVVALGGSVATPDAGLDLEVVAASSLASLSAMPRNRVEGRIVFLNARTERTRDGSGYGVTSDIRRKGAATAGALGAAAVVIRSIATGEHRFAHTGSMVYAADVQRIPAVAIANPDADMLERRLARGETLRLQLRVTARELPDAQSANVIAEIPGSDLASEIILLGAHLDSWDLGTGALDDGAGVAIVTAAAKLIAGIEPRPRRTIRVVLFANEEFGLSGGKAYATQDAALIARHVLVMGADLGAGPVWRLDSRVSAESTGVLRQVARALATLGVKPGLDGMESIPDVGPLETLGVPSISPALDATQYFDVHHSADDVLPQVDERALRQSVAVYATVAYLASRTTQPWARLR